MNIKNFNQYILKENILNDEEDDEDEGYEKKWEVKIDGVGGSYWEFKYDVIESIIEILDTQGDDAGLDGYEDPEEEYEMSTAEICDMLTDMDEVDFYEKLDELKEFVGYDQDIRLINIDDDDEIEFLEED